MESSSVLNLSHMEYLLPLSQLKEGIFIADEHNMGMYGFGEPLHVPVVPPVLSEHAVEVVIAIV